QSLEYIDRAYEFIKETVAHGGSILYVGTKKQAQEAIAEQARRVGMPFVNQRLLGGMVTNFGTVVKRLQRLQELEEGDFDGVALDSELGSAEPLAEWERELLPGRPADEAGTPAANGADGTANGAAAAPPGTAAAPPAGAAAAEAATPEAAVPEAAGSEPAGSEPAGTEPAGTEPAGDEAAPAAATGAATAGAAAAGAAAAG